MKQRPKDYEEKFNDGFVYNFFFLNKVKLIKQDCQKTLNPGKHEV